MNVVIIIPTGIGCEIGGHAGDATPAARLLASCCDRLIIHPNVVNASDINEMPENSLYVEGSILDRFLQGAIELEIVKSNRILLVVNEIQPQIVNAASAARACLGVDVTIAKLKTPLIMRAEITDRATGVVLGWRELVKQVNQYEYDALAIATPIECSEKLRDDYWTYGGVNPWGGVEAKVSRLIATALNKPVAHAPTCNEPQEDSEFISDPRMAAEVISWAFLHCVLKGLHKAPRIGNGISVNDVDCLVTPVGCVGRPHHACLEAGIPIIAVKENTTVLNDSMPEQFIFVENYLEAAGMLMSMKAGVTMESLKRPLPKTIIL